MLEVEPGLEAGILEKPGAGLARAPYLAALNNPSSWSQSIFPHYRGTVRGAFEVKGRRGAADGGVIATLRFASGAQDMGSLGRTCEALLPALAEAPGVVRAEAWLVNVPATTPATREKELRVSAEAYPAYVFIAEGTRADARPELEPDQSRPPGSGGKMMQ